MAVATLEQVARINAETEFRSSVIDPLPTYPEHAGKLSVDLCSGGLRIDFTYGYKRPSEIHAAIARLRDTLDQLDIDVDEAIGHQAMAALPDGVVVVDLGAVADGEVVLP